MASGWRRSSWILLELRCRSFLVTLSLDGDLLKYGRPCMGLGHPAGVCWGILCSVNCEVSLNWPQTSLGHCVSQYFCRKVCWRSQTIKWTLSVRVASAVVEEVLRTRSGDINQRGSTPSDLKQRGVESHLWFLGKASREKLLSNGSGRVGRSWPGQEWREFWGWRWKGGLHIPGIEQHVRCTFLRNRKVGERDVGGAGSSKRWGCRRKLGPHQKGCSNHGNHGN